MRLEHVEVIARVDRFVNVESEACWDGCDECWMSLTDGSGNVESEAWV